MAKAANLRALGGSVKANHFDKSKGFDSKGFFT
jgi:hypothetical protein